MKRWEKDFETNRLLWDARTGIHLKSGFYDADGFRSGKSTLNAIEIEEIGNVSGKTMLHLQCHFGLDTLSWARRGAMVTGIDFSGDSISVAKKIAAECKIPANFVLCNVYDSPEFVKETFDIVFASFGALPWLPDLKRWMEIASGFLKPEGILYLIEFHPILNCFDNEFREISLNYFHGEEPHRDLYPGTYADPSAAISLEEAWWAHPLSEIINAAISASFKLEFIHEFPYSFYNCFPNFVACNDGNFRWRNGNDTLPVMFSLKAAKGS